MDNDARTDAMLMDILEDRKTVTGFLDAIFGFLRRKTDFYHIQKSPSEKIGFSEGVREKILFAALQRYDPNVSVNLLTTETSADDVTFVPPATSEVEVTSESMTFNRHAVDLPSVCLSKNSKPKVNFAPVDYRNGAKYDKYCWSQTTKDIEVLVKLPIGNCNSKSIQVDLKPDKLLVLSKVDANKVILSGQLSSKCKFNDAVWTITENELVISFDKAKDMWWERLFVDEPSIDVKKLDSEVYIDALPEESQAAIRKLSVEQMEKDLENDRLRRETDNSKTIEKLRVAWNAENSPFKDQPFDPSVLQFQSLS